MNFQKCEFVKTAVSESGFIRDGRPQIVFAGKSNVGKSSVINSLVGRKGFARVGAAPGKTTNINYFLIDNTAYLTDLPGYGYAKVSKNERDRWGKLLELYFSRPDQIGFGVLLVDIRHAPTADDRTMNAWFASSGRPYAVVANKLDKIKKSELENNLNVIRSTLELDDSVTLIPYSAENNTNRDALISVIVNALHG